MEGIREYTKVTRYICEDCGMEVGSTKIHDQFHEMKATIQEGDDREKAEVEAKKASPNTVGWLPDNGQVLRSDGEWPR